MSVKFWQNSTLYPLYSRYLRSVSNVINGRAFPRWKKLYTVGPHAYILTLPGSIGMKSSLLRVIVFNIFILPPSEIRNPCHGSYLSVFEIPRSESSTGSHDLSLCS